MLQKRVAQVTPFLFTCKYVFTKNISTQIPVKGALRKTISGPVHFVLSNFLFNSGFRINTKIKDFLKKATGNQLTAAENQFSAVI